MKGRKAGGDTEEVVWHKGVSHRSGLSVTACIFSLPGNAIIPGTVSGNKKIFSFPVIIKSKRRSAAATPVNVLLSLDGR